MNYDYPGHGAAADPWCDVADDTSGSFADMIWDYSMDDPFFGLDQWEQGGGSGAAAPGSPAPLEVRFDNHPPSEEEMVAWLRAIVKGEEPAFNDDKQMDAGGGRDVLAKGLTTTTMDKKEEKLPMAEDEGMMGTKRQELRKTPAAGGSPTRSHSHHHGEAHNLTEKRRRNKINERFRTLQQLVPGCDKCNQVSTLDHTIQYMKSLQHQVQAMCIGGGPARPLAPQHAPQGAAAVAVPMMLAAPVVLAAGPTMVLFRAMVQLPHYPAAAVPPVAMMPAAAAPLYPAAAAASPLAPAGAARSIASHRQGTSSSRNLRQKQGK